MADKGIQVVVGLKRPRLTSQATQTPSTETKESGTQCGHERGSYGRNREHRLWRYDDLVRRMMDKDVLRLLKSRTSDAGSIISSN